MLTTPTPADGCGACSVGRDDLTGNGRLDVTAAIHALQGQLPAPDRFEPNDDVGREAQVVYGRALRGRATLDTWDDPNDVYRIRLKRGQRPLSGRALGLAWTPRSCSGSRRCSRSRCATDSLRARRSIHPAGAPERIRYRARRAGWYYLQVKLARPGSGSYSIRIAS